MSLTEETVAFSFFSVLYKYDHLVIIEKTKMGFFSFEMLRII